MEPVKQRIAYQGSAFVIEWFFDQDMKSQALEYFLELNDNRQDQVMKLFKLMGERGKINNITKFRNEDDGIYAFKPQPDRFLCFFRKGKKIVVTNAFEKKQDKLPQSEKDRALRAMKDYDARVEGGIYYGK
ncbi:MAG: type II toxin-antitoxin system RelE/ParE family toxin [Chlamydiia bacterium]|nr:type II toxin-antitoxin system RelE/ParE family toxin [Chlamydiia bacterium]